MTTDCTYFNTLEDMGGTFYPVIASTTCETVTVEHYALGLATVVFLMTLIVCLMLFK